MYNVYGMHDIYNSVFVTLGSQENALHKPCFTFPTILVIRDILMVQNVLVTGC